MFKLNQEQGKPDKIGLNPNQVLVSNSKLSISTLKETISSFTAVIPVTISQATESSAFQVSESFAKHYGRTKPEDFLYDGISQKTGVI